ncbi:MAG: tRNA nucleotidyltransferase (CCA-adding enzyme) [Cognaticolwellia sp.]|jgi:tRNA nucleotidyltransferase (CCA-adding enzyme)
MESRLPQPQLLMERAVLALGVASSHVRELGRRAQARGERAWLVGGGVRDLLLDRPIQDVDLCFDGDVLAWAPALVRELGGELVQHYAFRTATWTVDGLCIDLISARSERYPHPGSLPEVALADLELDLARRDFSVNAMAMAVYPAAEGEVVDPQQGHGDLVNGVLRVLHPRSFVDDPTRALRGARYAARLDLDLHPSSRSALDAALPEFSRLGLERLGKELGRVFGEERAVRALELLEKWAVLPAFGQVLSGISVRVQATLARAHQLGLNTPSETLGWVGLAHHLGSERGRFEALVRSDGGHLALWQHPAVDGLDVGREPGEWGLALEHLPTALLALVDEAAADWWCFDGAQLRSPINGAQLMAAGLSPGPGMGAALRRAKQTAWRGGNEEDQLQAALSPPIR